MRKIISQHEKKRKEKRNHIILAGFLVFIMFLSTLGYSFLGQDTENVKKIFYNELEFINQNGFWILDTDNAIFAFKNNPREVEEIYSYVNPVENYYNKPLYILSDNREVNSEIYTNLNQFILRLQPACINSTSVEMECDSNLPVKTCEDNFIIFRENNESSIVQEKNCVFIEGKSEDLIKITDEFLFKILKIRE